MRAMAAAGHTGRVVAALALVLVLAGFVRLDDDATARWTPTLGQRNELTATALATGGSTSGGASSSGWLVVVAVVGGLAVLTAGLALFLTRRREQSRPVPLTPLPSDTEPPPPLSALNRPTQPLPRPLPPPEPPE